MIIDFYTAKYHSGPVYVGPEKSVHKSIPVHIKPGIKPGYRVGLPGKTGLPGRSRKIHYIYTFLYISHIKYKLIFFLNRSHHL